MAMCTCIYFIFINFLTLNFVSTVERKNYNSDNEKRWNTPPELIPEALSDMIKIQHSSQPRFLPFSASFTVNSGSSNSHSLSIAGTNNGISLSQSQSMASSAFENVGSTLSTSQSSSFSAGLSGLSSSNSNAFNLNQFGGQSNVNSNSFAIGQASSSSNGKINNNNQAVSSAQSSVGSWNSATASGLGGSGAAVGSSYEENNKRRGKPSWTNISPNYNVGGVYMTPGGEYSGRGGFYGGHDNRPLRLDIDVDDSQYQQTRPTVLISDYRPSSVRNHRAFIDEHSGNIQRYPKQPSLQVSAASASSSSNSQNGFSTGQSSSYSGHGQPSSWTQNYGQTTGNAQSHSQATSSAFEQNNNEKIQASFSSGSLALNSYENGQSQGLSSSGNHGQQSHGHVKHQTFGQANVQGSANSGSVIKFPNDNYNNQNIQREFIRSRTKKSSKNPINEFFTDLSDTVVDLFEF
ncbi:hypothetical protein HCN44_000097 [Aphidius gifuensis]|uniref:Uncharacterized protein n=1 Tax=Aphidius gifuensis TaxID=684658 RepID=A0A834XRD9_APHGI|nr:hornerin-like [Aphidius gifuensis]KAF7990292.1 hypothetical protein HCN44_000097 [Aphidius gifuensis]